MSETAVICLDDARPARVCRCQDEARQQLGSPTIANSWGDTMDDRETLGAIRLFNRTGSMFAGATCSIH
ncbi:hypothetical protein [Mesorhizobium sp.]|uniref:hypothetical protein n=1 Tax=Mesorhizobium sp. TaxID=1871066 RepID=UPI00257E44F1|nr:hypothetical protein [Mesorhizobium sp.]